MKNWKRVKSLSNIGYGFRNINNRNKTVYINHNSSDGKYIVVKHISGHRTILANNKQYSNLITAKIITRQILRKWR